MVIEVCGVREAIAANVGAGGIFGVGPPVIALGEVVVRAAFASCGVDAGDGVWLLVQVLVRGGEDASVVDFCDVDLRLSGRSEAPNACRRSGKKLSPVHRWKSIAGRRRAAGGSTAGSKGPAIPFWERNLKSFEIVLAIRLIDLVKDFRTTFSRFFSSRKNVRAGPKGNCLEEFIFQAYLCAPRRRRCGFRLCAIVCDGG
jgi:hypothetical protein